MPMNAEASKFLESVIRVVEGTDDLPRHSRIVMAQELYDLRRALNADFTEMQQQIEVAADCVQRIVDNWQSGDLAHAVNMAEEWRTEAMTIFPDFNWIDDEADSDDDDFDHAAAADGKSTFDHDRAQDGVNPVARDSELEMTFAGELEIGDAVDLEGCTYANPDSFPMAEFELYSITGVERETADCVRLDFEGAPSLGLPPGLQLPTKRRDE